MDTNTAEHEYSDCAEINVCGMSALNKNTSYLDGGVMSGHDTREWRGTVRGETR